MSSFVKTTAPTQVIRILLVGDIAGKQSRVPKLLSQSDLQTFKLDCVTSKVAFRTRCSRSNYDICIIDTLGKSEANLLAKARRVGCTIPLIVITSDSASEALQAIRLGASDCLVRDELTAAQLERSICLALERGFAAELERENADRYLGLVDNASDVIYTHDLQGNYTSVNRAVEHLTGYTVDEALQMNVTEVVAEEFLELADKMINCKVEEQGETFYEIEIVTKSGKRVPVEVSTHLIYKNGEPVGVQGIARDITQRREAEGALRESEERYRELFENANDIVYTHDLNGDFTSLNRAGELITGYSRAEALRLNVADVIVPEHMEKARSVIKPGNADDGTVYNLEIFAKDGRRIPLEVSARVIVKDGRPLAVQGIARDTTERKRAEEALQQSEEKYRGIFDNASMGIYRSTRDGRLLTANEELARMLDYSSVRELLGCNLARDIYYDEDERARLIAEREPQGSAEGLEVLWKKKDGSPVWVHLNARSIKDKNGDTVYFDGFVHDITKRKSAEEALRESEERYQRLVELSPDAIIVHTDGKISFVNSSGLKFVGAGSQDEVIGKTIFDFLVPEQRNRFYERIASLQRGEYQPPVEVTGLRLDGTEIDCEVMSVPFLHDDKPAVQVVVRDIGERKRAHQALQEANKRALAEYESLVERMAVLGQTLGHARELTTILRAIRDFAVVSVPCDGMVISLYEQEKGTRKPVYCWVDKTEFDAGTLPEVRVKDGMTGRAIRSGSIVIDNDYDKTVTQSRTILIGSSDDGRPHSALSAPMVVMGRTVGCIEIQSYEANAYTEEHATAMRMAANLAANAVENVALIQREREKAEQLRQSQKMEAVGQLAGGVAHDFNNLLTAITGYSELSLKRLPAADPLRKNLEEIKRASGRATSLTRQLLAFSRKQMLQAKIIDLNAVVDEIDKMLRRLIGEDIDLVTLLEPGLCKVKGDPGQIEQVMLNLAVNARDAMPQGGKLTIETCHVNLDETYAQTHLGLKAGQYVLLAVSDTGTGMDAETQKRIFEPFFTTKPVGKGTGLGLSTVYGIISQSDGSISVYSEPGKGSTFKIYLPVVREAGDVEARNEPQEVPQGRETILLVEDEEMVRNLSREILEMSGYRVLVAANGEDACRICMDPVGDIHLMVTDVVMPQMSGRELAERVALMRPETRVLYMSGYTDDAIVRHGVLEKDMSFLQKPFTPDSLARKVREVLESGKGPNNN